MKKKTTKQITFCYNENSLSLTSFGDIYITYLLHSRTFMSQSRNLLSHSFTNFSLHLLPFCSIYLHERSCETFFRCVDGCKISKIPQPCEPPGRKGKFFMYQEFSSENISSSKYDMEKDKSELASHVIFACVFASKNLIFYQKCVLLA